MSEAIVGLVGVLLGGLIAGVTAHLSEVARWRRDQFLSLHGDLAGLHATKWPGGEWYEVVELLARIRVRMLLLGYDVTLLDEMPERIGAARRTAKRVPGHELDEDTDFVWTMDSGASRAFDAHLDQLIRVVTPRKRRLVGVRDARREPEG